ncbi:Sulfotransferase family protein [Cognatiyoonia koreensis]|uniref:Sulfotransferase family protein n=2 Tax=Cognatiyoonia koreensis TaxID=364200 RepID=A0A1I0RLL3_9RHOB|nr:Sulfotransferase family protein [Cognatiyoonia koreensis]
MLFGNPSVWLPPIKELHHFDLFDQSGNLISDRLHDHRASRIRAWAKQPWHKEMRNPFRPEGRERFADVWAMARYELTTVLSKPTVTNYLKLFENARRRGRIAGEITPAYATLKPHQVAEIKDAVGPDLKVFFILRDPIDRMWSHATKHFVRTRGKRPGEVDHADYLAFVKSVPCQIRTDYATTLATWRSVFGDANVLTCYFDDIRDAPQDLLDQIETFLGVPSDRRRPLLPANNSYRNKDDGIPPMLRPWLSHFSMQQCMALAERDPHPHIMRWMERAKEMAQNV